MYVAYEIGLFSICRTEMGLKDFSFTQHTSTTFFKYLILNRIFRHFYKLTGCLKIAFFCEKMEMLILRKAVFVVYLLRFHAQMISHTYSKNDITKKSVFGKTQKKVQHNALT